MQPSAHDPAKIAAIKEEIRVAAWKGLGVAAKNRGRESDHVSPSKLWGYAVVRDALPSEIYSGGHEASEPLKVAMAELLWDWATQGILMLRHAGSYDPWQFGYLFTSYGLGCLDSEEAENSPYDPDGYLRELESATGGLDPVIRTYLGEALTCFNRQKTYLAAMVMLGGAAEKALLLLCDAGVPGYTAGSPAAKLFSKVTGAIGQKEGNDLHFKQTLQRAVREDWKPQLDAGFHIIRVSRNDAGHPHLMSPVGRIAARDRFIIFSTYVVTVYALIKALRAHP